MIVVIVNRSKKKSFRRIKRIITALLPPVSNRVSIGDVPKRILLNLIKNLRDTTTKGVCIQLFFEEKEGFRGFKCIEFGTKLFSMKDFVNVKSKIDTDLLSKGIVIIP